MCLPALFAALGTGGAAAATAAAGSTAFASTLTTLGTIASVVGPLMTGMQAAGAAQAQADAIAYQQETEAKIAATQDQRERQQFMAAIADQRAAIAARGVQLDSVTAIALGETAAREMSFQSQATRSGAAARKAELTAARKSVLAQKSAAIMRGTFSALDGFVTAAPDIWPSLKGAA